MIKNCSIRCNVEKCKHNTEGTNCMLNSIKVTCCCGENCTCCGDYEER